MRLNAKRRMSPASMPPATSSATRPTSVLVLPEPAGASTRAAPRPCSTAARCAVSSCVATESGGRAADLRAVLVPPRRRAPMSSRSSRARSPTDRDRRSKTVELNGKPMQNGELEATRGYANSRRIAPACARSSSSWCSQNHVRIVQARSVLWARGSTKARRRSRSLGSAPSGPTAHERLVEMRAPGNAAAHRDAASRRPETSNSTSCRLASAFGWRVLSAGDAMLQGGARGIA